MASTPPPNADVRQRGFASRSSVESAVAWVDRQTREQPTESVSLAAAAGRVLAEAVQSPCDVPGFSRAMMDGFAVWAEDTHGSGPFNSLPLKVLGDALPGVPFVGSVVSGQAVRITTGAPIPSGATAVLPVEKTRVAGDQVWVMGEVAPGKHVGAPGEDISRGETVLPAGRRLRPQDLGVLASIGRPQITVVRTPRVRLAITGNELLPAGTPPAGCRIADANGPMLSALVRRDGGDPRQSGIVPDEPTAIHAALHDDVDVVLVSGGSSVGQEDHAPLVLAKSGELAIHGIAMRPSSPAGMGRLGDRLVFLLPGNPVSCLCAYDFFAGRAIRRWAGLPAGWPYRTARLPLQRKLVSQVGRVDYARVGVTESGVEPMVISGASILSSTTRADGFVVIPADSEGYPAGADVEVFLYD